MAVNGTAAHTDLQQRTWWRDSYELNPPSNVLSCQHKAAITWQTKKKPMTCIKPIVRIFHGLQYRMNTIMTTMIYVRSWGASYVGCCIGLIAPSAAACVWLMTQTHSFHLSDGLLDILKAVKIERFMRRPRPSVTLCQRRTVCRLLTKFGGEFFVKVGRHVRISWNLAQLQPYCTDGRK